MVATTHLHQKCSLIIEFNSDYFHLQTKDWQLERLLRTSLLLVLELISLVDSRIAHFRWQGLEPFAQILSSMTN